MDIHELSQELRSRAEEIASFLLPGGKRKGNDWVAGDIDGSEGKSLKVCLRGSKAGIWADFSSNDKGDLIELWRVTQGLTLAQTIKAIKQYLGISEPTFYATAPPKTYQTPSRPSDCKRLMPGSPVFEYLTGVRGISPDTLAAYQVADSVDRSGRPVIVFPMQRERGKLLNIKYLSLERDERGKKNTWFTTGCEPILVGWPVIDPNARSVIITEGEIDAMTWHSYGHPALSVPNGAKGTTWLTGEFEYLDRFDTIYLSFDMDEAGKSGLDALVSRLGRHRCRVVSLPYKDANECLQKGVSPDQMQECLAKAKVCDPEQLRSASEYVDKVVDLFYPKEEAQLGYKSPWMQLDGELYFRPGETSIWSGYTGHGKSMMLNQLMASAMAQGERFCIASLEMPPPVLLKRLDKQVLASKLPPEALIRKAHHWYSDRLWIFDLVGTVDAAKVLEVWAYAHKRYGVSSFVLDSLMRCSIGEEDYDAQKDFMNRLSAFALQYGVHVHLVAHSRKAASDKEAGGVMDVKGSSTITSIAHNVFITWRNKAKEAEMAEARLNGGIASDAVIGKADALFGCDKQREGEWSDRLALWFDKDSQQYLEHKDAKPRPYLPGEYYRSDWRPE